MKKKLMDLMSEIPFEGEPKAVTREPNDIGESTPVNSGTRGCNRPPVLRTATL